MTGSIGRSRTLWAEAVGLAQAKNTGQLDVALLPPEAEPLGEARGGPR